MRRAPNPGARASSVGSLMRICLVSEEQEGWGGIGTYTAVLARGLRDLGHKVHVVLRDWEQPRREQVEGIAIHRVTVPEPSWRRGTERIVEHLYSAREVLLWSRGVSRCVRAIAAGEGLDVVEVPEYRGAGALLALPSASPARQVPGLAVRLHTPAFLTEQTNEQRGEVFDRRAVEALERFAVRRADLLTAPSVAVARAVSERWHLPAGRVKVVPNPVDEQLFAPEPPHSSTLSQPLPSQPLPSESGSSSPRAQEVVLCVGRLERIKGVDVLVAALPELLPRHPNLKLRLVGDDDLHGHRGGSMAAHLRALADSLGVSGALRIEGAVPHAQLPELLREASVCVVPSRWENLPYACIEAMACGRPVVASRVGGLSELVSDGEDGLLVRPQDPSALASAVSRLLDDPPLSARLGAGARATVESRFARAAVAREIAGCYRALC